MDVFVTTAFRDSSTGRDEAAGWRSVPQALADRWLQETRALTFDPGQNPPAGLRPRLDVSIATLPDPGPDNIGQEYFVVDENGGTQRKSNGLDMVKQAPGVNEYDTDVIHWADRPLTAAVGDKLFFDDIGNKLVESFFDGEFWQPCGGRQLADRQEGTVAGSAGPTSTATSPAWSAPAGLMNDNGGLEIIVNAGTDNTQPATALPSTSWNGTDLFDGTTSAGTKKTVRWRRTIRNQNAVNSQVVPETENGDLGGPGTSSNQVRTFSANTASQARAVGVAYTATHATSITAKIYSREIWWLG